MCKRQSVSFEDVRPDLKLYYKPELNDGKLMSEFSKSGWEKLVLCCPNCNTEKITYPNRAKNTKRFLCQYCNSLGVCKPELAKQWHPTKNENLTPFDVNKNSPKKVWWQCDKGHEWEMVIGNRAKAKEIVCKQCNSLSLNYPEIAKDWHPTKNGDLKPEDVAKKLMLKVWWICEKGHEWETYITHRTLHGRGCPTCKISKGEKIIADWLSKNDIEYVSQYAPNGKRYDFYLPRYKMFVEIHGVQHFQDIDFFTRTLEEQQRVDREKQQYAEEHGHYMMIDYREHNPDLALERFHEQFSIFLKNHNEVA